MADFLEDEKKVGAMLRYMCGDVALEIKERLQKLYSNPNMDPTVCEQCADWHWTLVKYSPDPVMVRKYISIIEYAYEYGIRLEDMESWKKTMRIIVPEEFMYKMKGFTQVPNIAILDDSHAESRKKYITEARDSSDVLW